MKKRYKLEKIAKVGTALTLVGTTIFGFGGCGAEKSDDSITTSVSSTTESTTKLLPTQEAVTYAEVLEINYGIIKEITEDINAIYKKYFGIENSCEYFFSDRENNVILSDDIKVYYPEDSILQNSENKYIISLEISNITNKEALNSFLQDVQKKYNFYSLNITDDSLAQIDTEITQLHTLHVWGTEKISEPVSLKYFKDLEELKLNGANVFEMPKSINALFINDSKLIKNNYSLAYELEEIEFLPNLELLWLSDLDFAKYYSKDIITSASKIFVYRCKGQLEFNLNSKLSHLYYEEYDGIIYLRGTVEEMWINGNEDNLVNLIDSAELWVNSELVYSLKRRPY